MKIFILCYKRHEKKSMNQILGERSEQDAPACISKVVWDNDDEIGDDTETDGIE